MSDEPKEVQQKSPAEDKTQLSEEALKKVSGGNPSESVSLNYEEIKFQYTPQKRD